MILLAQRSKNSTCVTENPKKAGDSSRCAADREKGLKILRLPQNAGELTAMLITKYIRAAILKVVWMSEVLMLISIQN